MMGLENIRGTWKNADWPNAAPGWKKGRGLLRESFIDSPQKIEYSRSPGTFATKDLAKGTVRYLRLNGNAVVIKPDGGEYAVFYHPR